MCKMLSLSITDEELRSSYPPKPEAGAWEQFLPDSKTLDGKPIADAAIDGSSESHGVQPTLPHVPIDSSLAEAVPREVGFYFSKEVNIILKVKKNARIISKTECAVSASTRVIVVIMIDVFFLSLWVFF